MSCHCREESRQSRPDPACRRSSHLSSVRATALSLLAGYQGTDILKIFQRALLYLPRVNPTPEKLVHMVSPFLDDPVRGVRIEAARTLTVLPRDHLPGRIEASFHRALAEFRDTATYSADFSASRLNLGTLDFDKEITPELTYNLLTKFLVFQDEFLDFGFI